MPSTFETVLVKVTKSSCAVAVAFSTFPPDAELSTASADTGSNENTMHRDMIPANNRFFISHFPPYCLK